MHRNAISRRSFSLNLAAALPSLKLLAVATRPAPTDEITHTCAAIHQEVIFKSPHHRVYEVLLDTKQFDKVVQLSAAMKSGMSPNAKPTEINREAGGAFSAFGGYITGRQIELVTNERIVQAWRVGSWPPGIYSIAKFEFTEQDSGTKLIFDHTGFPEAAAQHLAEGWHANYWEPLEKFLAQP